MSDALDDAAEQGPDTIHVEGFSVSGEERVLLAQLGDQLGELIIATHETAGAIFAVLSRAAGMEDEDTAPVPEDEDA